MACRFCTDGQLCIVEWGQEISDFTGKSFAAVRGKKYFEVVPRIVIDDVDAVFKAFEEKDAVSVKGYCFNCFFGQTKADIHIRPLMEGDTISGVEVDILPISICSVSSELLDSQRFIEIGKIASTLAHGVRNPLNAIKGAIVYLREKYAGESTLVEFTKIIEDEILRLDNFISRFLSTTMSGTELTEVDVNALLSRIKIHASFQSEASSISSVYEFGDVPPVMATQFHLEQAILNVVNNAIEAMPSSAQLIVRTKVKEQAGGRFVVIEISDTGPGMPGGVNRTRKEKSRGFGLFITDEILKYYGGHLEIESRKGKGTVVRLCLPAKQVVKDE